MLIDISFSDSSTNDIIERTIERDKPLLKDRYKFNSAESQVIDSKKVLMTCSLKDLLNDQGYVTEEASLAYLTFLGFVSLRTIQEVEQMEKIQRSKIFEEITEKNANQDWFEHLKSRKVSSVKKSDVNCFVNKLFNLRGEIEQLSYLDEEKSQSWRESIDEIDFLTDNLSDFISDIIIIYVY